MKRIFFFIIFLIISGNIFAQALNSSFKNQRTKPYFPDSAQVNKSFYIGEDLYKWDGDSWEKSIDLLTDFQTKNISIYDTVGSQSIFERASSNDLYVIKDNQTIWFRSKLSNNSDIVIKTYKYPSRNQNYTFGQDFKIPPSTENTAVAYAANGTVIHVPADDMMTLNTNNTGCNLGGAHQLIVNYVGSTGHDKTAADLGSIWANGTHTWQLLEINGTDSLIFRPVAYQDAYDNWTWYKTITGDLTWVSGGVHHNTITNTVDGLYTVPTSIYKNHTIKSYINGEEEITGDFSGYCNFWDVVEQYTIADPRSTPVTDPMDWTQGDDWFTYTVRYRFQGSGSTTIYAQIQIHDSLSLKYALATFTSILTKGSYDDVLLNIPKIKSYIDDGYTWDFANTDTLPLISDKSFFSSDINSLTNPPERVIMYLKNDGEKSDLAFAFGNSLNYPGTDSTARAKWATENYCIISSSKYYPFPIYTDGSRAFIDTTFTFIAYRNYFDPSACDSAAGFYYQEQGNYTYVYIMSEQAFTNDTIPLPSKFYGKSISVVEKNNMVAIDYTVKDYGISVSSSGDGGYLVLRLFGNSVAPTVNTNQIEIKASFKNNYEYSGQTVTKLVRETVAFGDLCYVTNQGSLLKSSNLFDANQARYIALETITGGTRGLFLRNGYIYNTAWNWTPGSLLYTGVGAITATLPDTTEAFVQVIGTAESNDVINFNPEISSYGDNTLEAFANTKYLDLDGTNEYLSFTELNLGDTATICAWVKTNNTTTANYCVLGNSATDNAVPMFVPGLNRLYCYVDGTSNYYALVDDEIWNFYVVVRYGTAVKIYRNGVAMGAGTITSGSGDMMINTIGRYKTNYAVLSMDEVTVFDHMLSSDERLALYGDGTPAGCGDPRPMAGLIYYWNFEQTSTTVTEWVNSVTATQNNLETDDIVSY